MEWLVIAAVIAFMKRSSTSAAAPASSYVVKPAYRPNQESAVTSPPFTISDKTAAAIAAGRERIGSGQLSNPQAGQVATVAPPASSGGWTISQQAAQVATDVSIPRYTTPATSRPTKHRDTTTDDIIDRKGL